MLKKKKMTIGNLNCVFESKENTIGFFDLWDKFTRNVFQENKPHPPKREPKFLFYDVKIDNDLHNEPVIIGKIVKVTTLDIMQEFNAGKLCNVDNHYPSAPSSVFVLLIRNHLLLFLKEHRGAPSVANFRAYFTDRVRIERQKYIAQQSQEKKLTKKELAQKYPPAIINYTGMLSNLKLTEFFTNVQSVRDLHIITNLQNSNYNIKSFFEGNQDVMNELKSPKIVSRFTKVKSTDGTARVLKNVSTNAAAGFRFDAVLEDGTVKRVTNENITIEAQIPIVDEASTVDISTCMLKELKRLIEDKEITDTQSTTLKELINSISNDNLSE
ncbi:MAG: hypothetical protein K8S56_06830 [Candidatus Cloacimonetes bacterium]|nr:hypothetical protein [Candidatus Cloacimonadota bacterium]